MRIIPASRLFVSTDIEDLVTYDRSDGKHVEMTVCFIARHEAVLSMSVYADRTTDRTEEALVLSLSEGRLLRDLLNRPDVAVLLEDA